MPNLSTPAAVNIGGRPVNPSQDILELLFTLQPQLINEQRPFNLNDRLLNGSSSVAGSSLVLAYEAFMRNYSYDEYSALWARHEYPIRAGVIYVRTVNGKPSIHTTFDIRNLRAFDVLIVVNAKPIGFEPVDIQLSELVTRSIESTRYAVVMANCDLHILNRSVIMHKDCKVDLDRETFDTADTMYANQVTCNLDNLVVTNAPILLDGIAFHCLFDVVEAYDKLNICVQSNAARRMQVNRQLQLNGGYVFDSIVDNYSNAVTVQALIAAKEFVASIANVRRCFCGLNPEPVSLKTINSLLQADKKYLKGFFKAILSRNVLSDDDRIVLGLLARSLVMDVEIRCA